MHISRIEIQNIKSHTSSSYELARGTTAITGPNGAGKSTIVEAVAWVLFDLLEYKKEDFVRRGEKKGSVNLTFESGLDQRQYTVFRDTGSAYNVIDPRLGMRIADKKEEVFRFLWQHLGLEPGTDLRSLFRQAIGVPQGTLTSIFLEGAVERKTAFDRLLKVEEYRQAAEKLRETSRFLEHNLGRVRESIARSEGILSRFQDIETQHETSIAQVKLLNSQIKDNQQQQEALRAQVVKLDALEKKVSSLTIELEKLRSRADGSETAIARLRSDVSAAEQALAKVESVRPAAEQHIKVIARLQELDRERIERDRLRAELSKVEKAITTIEADKLRLSDELSSIQRSRTELAEVAPQVEAQVEIESRLNDLRNRAAEARSAATRLVAIDEELERLRESYRTHTERVREIEESTLHADDLDKLEGRHAELIKHVAEMRAGLNRDEKFQSEIRNGLCPVLSQKCLNLAPGQTLQGFITSQFGEVKAHITQLESEQKAVETSLISARAAGQQHSAAGQHRHRLTEIKTEAKRLQDERDIVDEKGKELPTIIADINAAERELKKLDDPRARQRMLQKLVEREPVTREGLSDAESNLERLNSERQIFAEQMEPYTSLDENWTTLSAERDATIDAYRTLLANESTAAELNDRGDALKKAEEQHGVIVGELTDSEKALAEISAGYDRDVHDTQRTALRDLENSFHSASARLEAAEDLSHRLGGELTRFSEIRRSLQEESQEKERLETTAEATAFIRDTLKEAAPRVARNYVYHVSLEANQLFREISGNPEQTLKWGEDYSVALDEDGYERPFVSFSGGEQTAAALAIRLGLLKQLTDIRIAFFDEPTANMDADRRENLGQQISRITHFDQLIVISHDDTFDSYVDHVIPLG
jgi:exonuclease SbcC